MTPTESDPWWYVPEESRRVRYDRECISIPHAVRRAAKRFGETEAVVDGSVRISFLALESFMYRSVRAMIASGIKPGDRVAIWAPNSWQWIVTALGLQGAGAILVPLNTRYKGAEAADILRSSVAEVLFVGQGFLGTDYAGMLRAADPALPVHVSGSIVSFGEAADGVMRWADFLAAGEAVPAAEAIARVDSVGGDQLSDIMFTSGTTGRPKGVMVTHAQSLRAFGWFSEILQFHSGDRFAIIPPFFHSFGYKAGWMSCLIHGVTALPVAVFDADRLIDLIEAERVSILLGPPTMFHGILGSPRRPEADLSSLRVTMASAATVSPELLHRMSEELGSEVTVSSYGLTESTAYATVTIPGVDDFEDIVKTAGRASLDVETRVVDDAGAEVPRGSPGELQLRGFNVMQGYWQDPEQTAETITSDGWLRTGDVAVKDERGYIRITDRKKDVVIVGGFNVYPAEVEIALGAHPAVDAVAVVGMPDERMGEVPIAFIVPVKAAEFDPDELLSWAKPRLANFKLPRRIVVVDDLPRNAAMKILKHELRLKAGSM